MRDRLVTAAGAALLVLLAYGLLTQRAAENGVPRPTSEEARADGYLGLRRWLEGQGVRVISHRERHTALLDAPNQLAASGNLLVTTMPYRFRARFAEVTALREWVRRGNTLLVMAAINDTPEWSESGAFGYLWEDLAQITGMEPVWIEPEDGGETAGGDAAAPGSAAAALTIEPLQDHPLMRGLDRLEARSTEPIWQWGLQSIAGELLLELARDRRSGIPSIWQKLEGAGQVLVVASATLLTNGSIGAADNRSFVANLIRLHLQPGAAVLFDDMHQGLSALYDARAFFADPRLHRSVAFVVGWWLLWVVGASNRLARPRQAAPAPAQRDYVEAVGGFMARRLGAADAGRLMIERWFDEISGAHGIAAGERPDWKELRGVPGVGRELVDRIEVAYGAACRGERIDLVSLHNELGETRRAMG